MSPRPGILFQVSVTRLSIKPAMTKLWPSLQFKFGFRFAGAQGGNGKTGNGKRVGEIESADLGRHGEVDIAVRHDHRSELELYAKFLEGNRNRGESLAGLHNRKWKLASREKAGFLAVHGDQSRFGENLQQVLGFQSLDDRTQVNVGLE